MVIVSSLSRTGWSRQLFGRNLTFPFITTNHLMRVNLRTLSTRYQNCKSAPSVSDPNKEFKESSSKTKRKRNKNKELEELEKHDVTDKTSKILLEELWTHKTLAEELSLKPPSPVGCWQDIEAYKPKVKSLNIEEYKKLHSRINRGFVVEQVREFLKNHGQLSKGNKDIMVDDIIQKIWEVPKPIEILQESVQSKPMDIFFIVGPDGESLKWLESEANVKIYVDLSTITYTISGTKRDIRKTKEIIKKLTTYTTITVELPSHIKGESKTLKELMPYVQDICRTSGAFIELENNNKITISAQTQRNIKEAQRLLNIAWMQPDQNENHLILYSNKRETSKYCFLPVHDIVTLSMFHRNMYWHRLAEVSKSDEEPTVHNKLYRLHESKSVIKDPVSWSLYSKTEAEMDFNKLGSFLRTHLNTGRTPNTRLEIVSTFGHNIFHDKTKSMQNIFLPPLEGSHSREIIGKWYETKNPTKLFLPSYPQPDLLESLNQLSESQTVVQLDYLPCQTNSSDSICLTSDRLSFRFDVINKSLRLNDFSIYKRRLLVDILMMDCPKDIRLLSSIKESLLGSQDITHFVSQCTLYNSRDIQCPKEYVLEGKSFSVPYTLESARIHRNGYYEYNGFVLAVKKVVEQETNTVRPEISLLYEPSINSQSSPAAQSEVQNHEDFKHWKNFIFSAIRIANS